MLREGIAKHRGWIALSIVALALLAVAPYFLSPFHVRVGQQVLFAAGLALSWTILGGFAGYWSFGHAAFVGLGAFAASLSASSLVALPTALGFICALLIGSIACGVVAAIIAYPVLRLRGIYFAIAMLGVSQVLAELNNNLDFLKGSMGVILPRIVPKATDPATFFYYVFLVATLGTLLIAFAIKVSRIGYGLVAIREDEDTARMLGVPTERYKTQMFVLSAMLTGLFGVIYAWSLGYITTGSVYRTDFSLNMIVYSLLGGMGTLIGPIIGSLLMVVLTQVLLGRFLDVHMLMTGALLVAMVLLAPRGLVGFVRDYRERRRGRARSADERAPS
jgi:branched-chain amino acid transport system permease protein